MAAKRLSEQEIVKRISAFIDDSNLESVKRNYVDNPKIGIKAGMTKKQLDRQMRRHCWS
jgi:hypothetical protein